MCFEDVARSAVSIVFTAQHTEASSNAPKIAIDDVMIMEGVFCNLTLSTIPPRTTTPTPS